MFSKNDKSSNGSPVISISSKLTLLYVLTSFALLAVSGIYLYGALAHDLKTDDMTFLQDQMHFFKQVIHDRPAEFNELKEKIQLENSAGGMQRYFVRVLDDKKEILFQSSGIPVPPSEFSIFNERQINVENYTQKNWGKNVYLLASVWVKAGSGETLRLIEMAADVTTDEKILKVYRRKLTLILFGGILLASFTGMWITRKGLLPLKEMAESVKQISAEQLHERVMQRNWPGELRDLAVAFDGMLGRLEKSFAQISQFSADLAHELRTPVNNLMGETEVLLSKSRPPEEFKQLAESNLEEYGKLSRLIDDMLFLARAESKQEPLKKILFDPLIEIQTVKEFYEALLEEKQIEISVEGNRQILGDSFLFKRAMSNLISNAIKYTPNGGKINVKIRKNSDQAIVVTVQDTGRGINEKDFPLIFDRFFRVDQSRSNDPGGTGLGLSIVKSIMELHSGFAEVQSQPALGTTIALIFPQH